MNEKKNYDAIIEERAQRVFDSMRPRTSDADLVRLHDAFELAREAHAPQVRKTGEPYILHPIAVATIAAEELKLDINSVIAAFLHDVVEDTPHSLEEINARFGDDVAYLVKVLTKPEKSSSQGKQVDNFKQMLNSMQRDIRPIFVKLADRLHNMRTLSSMKPHKQMKIAGETDYFYAPLANRLGLYYVKTELENLSFKFRCPHDYEEISRWIEQDRRQQKERLERFRRQVQATLMESGIEADVRVEYREPYSIWRKMRKYGDDFNHLKYRHFTEIVFKVPEDSDEKATALKIYSILTDSFKEKPGGLSNYIDSPKENGYQSLHVKLLADFGRWQEVHINSERMAEDSHRGLDTRKSQEYIERWLHKFRSTLRDIGSHEVGIDFMEKVTASFYNDDIMVFTPRLKTIMLPQRACVLDFAYEISTHTGDHAKYARINGFLSSVTAKLQRGDVVEIFTDPDVTPTLERLSAVVTYKARNAIQTYLGSLPKPQFCRCGFCKPIPGEEVVGFQEEDDSMTLHKRDCPIAIRLASQQGDRIRSVDFEPDGTLYPVTLTIKAVDRVHLFVDVADRISKGLNLNITRYDAYTKDYIAIMEISFGIHSYTELETIIKSVSAIDGIDEVKRKLEV
ncbi:MAG: bifunctional (p)ppGpp synthetase/guanosine-3',5'-bis(diphosphate) 3'-pyrophosphohydrolase [Muribaculaceae bacterium]|nr:bifunctional (p)ppGpp synthetase/guanosine-3',5'-bis(diphosphate) 3'-pyrophosphohydrolase [Muribaculaceae bacterium]